MACPSQDMKLLVKHTFLEFVDSDAKAKFARGRRRVFTDSEFYSNSSSGTATPPDYLKPVLSDVSDDNDIPIVRVVPCGEQHGTAQDHFRESRSPSSSPWSAPRASPSLPPEMSLLPSLPWIPNRYHSEDSDGKEEVDFEQLPPMTSSWTSPCGWWWMPVSAVPSNLTGSNMTRCPSDVTNTTNASLCASSLAPHLAPNGCANSFSSDVQHSSTPYAMKAPLFPPGCFNVPASGSFAKEDASGSNKLKERIDFDKLLGESFFPSTARAKSGGMEAFRTTVMIRGLPADCTRALLIDLLNSEGFCGKYDFVYLPIDFNSGTSLGYAFVDLLSPETAQEFFLHFDGLSVRNTGDAQECCTVTWSNPNQGLAQHVERYRNSPVMHASVPEEWKPIIFLDSVPVSFPPPTKRIKEPKIKMRSTANCQARSLGLNRL